MGKHMTRSLELVSKSTISKDIFEKNISHTIIYHEKKKKKKKKGLLIRLFIPWFESKIVDWHIYLHLFALQVNLPREEWRKD